MIRGIYTAAAGLATATLRLGTVSNNIVNASTPGYKQDRLPDEVVASPFGPVPRPLRVSPALVGNQRITRITLTASASRRKTYGQPEAGNLHESASWTLTFTRLQP